MKFVDKIKRFEKTKWGGKLIDYGSLVKLLDNSYSKFVNLTNYDKSLLVNSKDLDSLSDTPYKALETDSADQVNSMLEKFHLSLLENIEKVIHNFDQVKRNNIEHFESISKLLNDSASTGTSITHIPLLLLDIWRALDELQDYIIVNRLAVSKICSRRNELFEPFLNNLPEINKFTSRFDGVKVDNNIREKVISSYVLSKEVVGAIRNTDAIENRIGENPNTSILIKQVDTTKTLSNSHIYELEAMMENIIRTKKTFDQSLFQPNFKMSFLIGICFVLLINLFVICRLPVVNSEYSIQGTLAIFPIFRLFLMTIFVVWGSGISIAIMDYYNVNYRYMIGIDPDCMVTPATIFSFAALQTCVWIVIFTMFISDYRLGISIFAYFNISHYPLWIYPVILMITQFIILFIPSRTFTFEYRKAVLYSIMEVFSHGLVPKVVNVSLRANIVGDIFTTLSKPFGDIEYTITFFVFVARNNGNILPKSLFIFLSNYRWMQTIALALPYEIRFFQCGMRYLTDKSPSRNNHLYNMGKYLTGLAIAVVATVPWATVTSMSPYTIRLLWFTCYIVGTIYMFSWDIYMDWGLMQNRVSFLRAKSMYPGWYYYFVAFYNLIGRLTWAITLIPITIIEDIQINAAIINLCVATIEIIRRTLWCTIRLEWEQVHLNSRQPANLWVDTNKKIY
ncbi:SYG1 ERD1 like integral membrane required for retention of ER lumen s [Cryptosporidium xiaoi]|uniref:SYG1 ERD1 like integral membrane required for retention of ER lumen s n=1 Tax=Cryptosporidium xiaoi TaxID=659607 RepID=A0AAV9XZU8_9CRYT